MRYVIAILLPPVGMLLCNKIGQAIICTILMFTCLGWPFASLWAVLVVNEFNADHRTDRLIREMRG